MAVASGAPGPLFDFVSRLRFACRGVAADASAQSAGRPTALDLWIAETLRSRPQSACSAPPPGRPPRGERLRRARLQEPLGQLSARLLAANLPRSRPLGRHAKDREPPSPREESPTKCQKRHHAARSAGRAREEEPALPGPGVIAASQMGCSEAMSFSNDLPVETARAAIEVPEDANPSSVSELRRRFEHQRSTAHSATAKGSVDATNLLMTSSGPLRGAAAGRVAGSKPTTATDSSKPSNVVPGAASTSCHEQVAGTTQDDIPQPRSYKEAEQAKIQDQQKHKKELQEKRERARVVAHAKSAFVTAATSSSSIGSSAAVPAGASGSPEAVSSTAGASETAAAPSSNGTQPEKAHRRSACPAAAEPPGAATLPALTPASCLPSSAPGAATTSQEAPPLLATPRGSGRGKVRPLVPVFSAAVAPDPSTALRQLRLPPPLAEDNYEISDHDSDPETIDKDRSKKRIPAWCRNHTEFINEQADWDPDTIFSSKVPHCSLEEIFPDALYKQAGKERPRRKRGSSQDWTKDPLTKPEVSSYKTRMGQKKCWDKDKFGKSRSGSCAA